MASHLHYMFLQEGSIICHKGQAIRKQYFILSGQIEIVETGEELLDEQHFGI